VCVCVCVCVREVVVQAFYGVYRRSGVELRRFFFPSQSCASPSPPVRFVDGGHEPCRRVAVAIMIVAAGTRQSKRSLVRLGKCRVAGSCTVYVVGRVWVGVCRASVRLSVCLSGLGLV
jgi:hypothetical protein